MSNARSDFQARAQNHTLIPVTREVFADLETPVTAFWKLQRGAWSFLLESVEGGETWARYTFMGTEPRAVFIARGTELIIHRPGQTDERRQCPRPLEAIAQEMEGVRVFMDPALPRFMGGLVGAVAYDAVRQMETLPSRNEEDADTPDLCFMFTRLVLVWDNLKHRAMLVYMAHTPTPDDADDAWQEAQAALDVSEARLVGPLPPMPAASASTLPDAVPSMTDDAFAEAVERAREFISAGDIIQVVLSRRFTQATEGLHPFLVYRTLRLLNPSPYMFYLHLDGTTLVGASPEVLVRVTDGKVETRPIAGTRPRGATAPEDEDLAAELAADPKERAEHVMLVDLGRNDVGRVAQAGSVQVTDLMVIERYSHVMHLVSHVTGQARPDVTAADVIEATFPAGTLSGAPKIRAMEIIEALEPRRRGFYGGAVGFLDATGNLDLCITIRTLVAQGDAFVVQAGAGIVWDSDGHAEAKETRDKALGVLKAIQEARTLFQTTETRP